MDKNVEQEGLKHIESISRQLSEIKSRTPNSKRAFKNGIFQGIGAVLGSIIAVALIGVLLALFGVIPGFDVLADYIRGLMESAQRR